jgi:RNA polymerase sigma-54 factor
MQNLGLHLSLQQKLSPQQIQFIKLLEIPTAELESRIEEELELNPALEEGFDEPNTENLNADTDESLDNESDFESDEMSLTNYLGNDDKGYKMSGDGPDPDEDEKESPLAAETSLMESLVAQLGFIGLPEPQLTIALQLIGSLDEDGYLRRKISAIVNDLAFTLNITTDEDEVLQLLYKIQEFDPAGIAARDLQECLLIQLNRRNDHLKDVNNAITIIEDCFEEFSKKHYEKIQKRFGFTDQELKAALKVITKCNPKPGGGGEGIIKSQYIIPDFVLSNNNGILELSLNAKNAPDLQISYSYAEMLDTYEKGAKNDKKLKEAVSFVKQKLDAAKWFIDAIKQRQNTLLGTMNAIIKFQKNYFLDGDEAKLRPMILKDIAEMVHLDISTVSRVAASKTIQTEFGVFPLKYFFSEGIMSDAGEDVSTREVKNLLTAFINEENKLKPLSDEELEKLLKEKGFGIARRTVAKYREQLNIPVARLRKEL